MATLPSSTGRRPHLPALDGLRGLAILMVFLHHTGSLHELGLGSGNEDAGFGRLGVDLFFCLSGFLITGILVAAKEKQHYFRNFYARRALRIFPLYYTYLLLYWVLVVHFQLVKFGGDKISIAARELHWAWPYGINFLIAKLGRYPTASLAHFWTLAIEEQFYFIWPLVVFFCSRRRLLQTAVAVTLGSVILRIALQAHGTPELVIRTSTLCRLDTFALGGIAALLLDSDRFRTKARRFVIPAMIPLFLVSAGLFYLSDRLFVSVGFTLVAIAFTLLIIATVIFADAPFTAILRSSTMRFFGKYSYAIYIFHMPIQRVLLRKLPLLRIADKTHSTLAPILVNILVVAAITLLAALISWNLLEKPALALKRFFPEPPSPLTNLSPAHTLTP